MSKGFPRLRIAPLGAALACALLLAGCTAYGYPHGGKVHHYRPYHAAHVPPGHLPPPGACRVWHPGVPPGHQPPPGPCGYLKYHVPPGAFLVRG